MNPIKAAVFAAILIAGCSSPESKQSQFVATQEDIYSRQIYERRTDPAVQETTAYHVFTNRLAARDTQPMDLQALGKAMVVYFGSNITWQVVTTAYSDYSHGAPLSKASDIRWLFDQTPRTRDTAWMVNYADQWMPK